MEQFRMVKLNGHEIGTIDQGSNRVKNKDGEVLYRIIGNKLVSETEDKILKIENDGRVADDDGTQVAFIYNYSEYKPGKSSGASTKTTSKTTTNKPTTEKTTTKTTSTASNTAKNIAEKAKETAKNATEKAKEVTKTVSEKPSTLKNIIIIAIAFFIGYSIFGTTSIEGTWEVKEIEIDGEKINKSNCHKKEIDGEKATKEECDKLFNSVTYSFNKEGKGSIVVSYNGRVERVPFNWSKKDKHTYFITTRGTDLDSALGFTDVQEGNELKLNGRYIEAEYEGQKLVLQKK